MEHYTRVAIGYGSELLLCVTALQMFSFSGSPSCRSSSLVCHNIRALELSTMTEVDDHPCVMAMISGSSNKQLCAYHAIHSYK